MLGYLKKRKDRKARAARIYACLNEQARTPYFYSVMGVPDTLDGRFELLLLHAGLAWRRLSAQQGAEGQEGRRLAQDLFDAMFVDINHALRQIGVGDLSVPHHVKRMMKAYKGRAMNYDGALRAGDAEALKAALRRNLYATAPDVPAAAVDAMAAYVRDCAAALESSSRDAISAGHLRFPALPQVQEGQNDARMVA